MKFLILLFALSLTVFSRVQAQTSADVLTDLTATLQEVSQIFNSNYALADYKNQRFGWKNEVIVQELLTRAQNNPNLTVLQAQLYIQEFFNSTRDYHAQAFFLKQPLISLPVGMALSQGRVFISYIDPTYTGPIQVGDEVIFYEDTPVMDKILELVTPHYRNIVGTDFRDATRRLTSRYGVLMDAIPASPQIKIDLIRADGSKISDVLTWKGHPALPKSISQENLNWTVQKKNLSHIPEILQGNMLDDAWSYLSRKSYFPRPDSVTWEASDTDLFYAWIGQQSGSNQRIGLIRIPSFSQSSAAQYTAAVKAFKVLVEKMNTETDVLVLDIQGNRGGNLDYGEALSSFFFDSPKEAYKFQYKLSPKLLASAQSTVNKLNQLKDQNDIVQYFKSEDYFGYPLDMNFVNDMKNMYQGLIDDAKFGTMAQPRYYNSSYVKPYPGAQTYLKPLFVATDSWSASCGDWFAGFMQDHKRATVIGTQTAGAGAFTGSAVAVTANSMLLKSVVAPIAVMYRLDGSKIENLGVTPDFVIETEPSDFIDGKYTAYKNKVYEIIDPK